MEVKDFDREVIAASHQLPVLVDFWAPWCQPCRVLGPVLTKLERQAGGRWRLAKLNTDEHPEVAAAWQIRGIPAVKLFHNGKMIAEFVGALPEREVLRWLEQHLPSASKQTLEVAKEALARRDARKARALLEKALQHDDGNEEVRVLLAEILFPEDPDKAVALLRNLDEGHALGDRISALRTLHRLLHLSPTATDGAAPEWARYKEGIAALRRGEYAQAFEAWIEVMERNRSLDDDGARKACVALFRLLGNEHPLTADYRRRFSSALY